MTLTGIFIQRMTGSADKRMQAQFVDEYLSRPSNAAILQSEQKSSSTNNARGWNTGGATATPGSVNRGLKFGVRQRGALLFSVTSVG